MSYGGGKWGINASMKDTYLTIRLEDLGGNSDDMQKEERDLFKM